MKIIRYLDIAIPTIGPNGEPMEEIIHENVTVPIILDPTKIGRISPLIAKSGKLFKNVSVLEYDNDFMKVVGNYEDLYKLKRERMYITGFVNGK